VCSIRRTAARERSDGVRDVSKQFSSLDPRIGHLPGRERRNLVLATVDWWDSGTQGRGRDTLLPRTSPYPRTIHRRDSQLKAICSSRLLPVWGLLPAMLQVFAAGAVVERWLE
jgi:hypothetical protein